MNKNKVTKISDSDKNCLSYDTEILAIVRGLTPIKISIGYVVEHKLDCLVYSVNRETDSTNIQAIAQWHDRGEQEIYEYTLENGTTIKATKDHKFMIEDGQMLPIDEIFKHDLDLICRHSYIIDGYDFGAIIPDSYTCPYTHGNTCDLGIIKFDTNYVIEHRGCTQAHRTFDNPELDRKYNSQNFSLCFDNWMLSSHLYYSVDKDEEYSNFSCFVNNCINGYRNITYIKQQQELDSNFTQEKSKTPKHTYIALNNAIQPSIRLYKSLQESGRFSEKQLLSFSRYLRFRHFNNCYRKIHARRTKDIDAQQEIFEYLIGNSNYINKIVTNEMIEEFQEQYKTYQEDAKKYAHETIEERRDRLNKERVVKGLRTIRFS